IQHFFARNIDDRAAGPLQLPDLNYKRSVLTSCETLYNISKLRLLISSNNPYRGFKFNFHALFDLGLVLFHALALSLHYLKVDTINVIVTAGVVNYNKLEVCKIVVILDVGNLKGHSVFYLSYRTIFDLIRKYAVKAFFHF